MASPNRTPGIRELRMSPLALAGLVRDGRDELHRTAALLDPARSCRRQLRENIQLSNTENATKREHKPIASKSKWTDAFGGTRNRTTERPADRPQGGVNNRDQGKSCEPLPVVMSASACATVRAVACPPEWIMKRWIGLSFDDLQQKAVPRRFLPCTGTLSNDSQADYWIRRCTAAGRSV